ncbi:hypothetical protein HPB48_016500 [Haemaphysalis longicornis]|uniref:Uncharacterized protein n=1 Tax=Haemaphysalis longicornis TaxID=44386 RepID=A0A9J6FK06_HAELO|nr:hypothetical protein HPB48_016500 [Haemaphysalis longicornis]
MANAKRQSTKTLRVSFDDPDPDRHLLHLWNRRLRIQSSFRARGRPKTLKAQLNAVQREIEQYTAELASIQWARMCEKINGSISSRRSWGILRSLLGQRRTADGAARMALKEGIGSEAFAEKAAEV